MQNITTYTDAQAAINSLDKDIKAMQANAAYLKGDSFQRGEAWGGPAVPPAMAGASETVTALEKDQAPIPVIAEIHEHYVTGVVGNEPAFQVELNREITEGNPATPEEEADLGLLNDALTSFFDSAGALEFVQDMVANLLSSRGTLRLYIPPLVAEKANAQGQRFSDLNEAATKMYLETPDWERAGVVTDRESMERTGIYLYSKEEPLPLKPTETELRNRAEVTEVNEARQTVFTAIDDQKPLSAQTFDCNGQIWIYQATLNRPIIGSPQRALQRKIDFLNYILPKNAQYAGFRERNFLNVNRPVDKVSGEPISPPAGPGVMSFWQPVTYNDKDGNPHPAPAQLVISEPVDSGPIREDIKHMIWVLLKSCHLLHTVISGDAVASAISRVQSRAQFTRALLKLKPKVERVLRELLETVLCLACQLSGQNDLLTRFKANYRIRVDVKPDAGPLTPEEVTAIITMREKGLLDLQTAQTMIGLEDIGSIANRLEAEQGDNVKLQMDKATLFNLWHANLDKASAAKMAKLSEDELAIVTAATERSSAPVMAGGSE